MTKKLLFILALLPCFALSQHTIKGTFSPANNYSWIIIYKVTPSTALYVDNASINQEGIVEIKLDATDTKGIYRIVYALPQEDYHFDIIYNGQEDVTFTFSEEKGVEFIESSENKLLTSYTKSILLVNQTLNSFFMKGSQDEAAFLQITETLKDAQTNFENAAKGKMVEHFIKANTPYIPSGLEDVNTYSKNVRDNYLNHVDFNDPTLQSSDFLIQRMLSYVFGMTSNPNDLETFKLNVNEIAKAINIASLDYQSTLLEILWDKFVEMDNEPMANYVATHFLMPITKELNQTELSNELRVYKNTSIGSLAPNFDIDITSDTNKKETTSLHNLKASQHYLLLFWSSSCGHCLDELPKLKSYLDTLPKGLIKVIAIGLEDEPYGWNNEIIYYPNFIHIYGNGKWDNPISNNYGITATPFFFLLDADKHILAKPDNTMALKMYLEK